MPRISDARADPLLTSRQQECLRGFWSRKSAKEIGQELGITHHAVEKHLLACRERLGVTSSIEAARLVFGDPEGPTIKPYYDASEVQPDRFAGQGLATPTPLGGMEGVTREPLALNRLGAVSTLLLILAVSLGSVLAVAALIAAADGANKLGRMLFS
ncbi:helix-turn-helix transcriptional regulator [Sphingomonas sp. KRR8]|uniref:response regulator transcription factor n=1 Tax=Sphingomonas sp. KRR8 TaxID=2942996 RepID=UPI002020B5FD|nr:helix-turn-helix transcriptional regulator [Sphingomonas sp. KRR8]URD60968.1 helix-turn-helix transcriptional regulator [Sphingomonas sp. KRR8]